MRACVFCQRALDHRDWLDHESHCMEAARQAMGVEGVTFRYYSCSRCGHDNVYLEFRPLPLESPEETATRRNALTQACAAVSAERTSVLVVDQLD